MRRQSATSGRYNFGGMTGHTRSFSALAAISTLLGALDLSACGGSSGVAQQGPGYILSATAPYRGAVSARHPVDIIVHLTATGGYSGTVALSCQILTAGAPQPDCRFSSSSVSLSAGTPAASTLTVSTTGSTPGGAYRISISAIDTNGVRPANGAVSLSLMLAASIQHIVVIFQENRTPDNLFQDPLLIAHGADIATSGGTSSGKTVALTPIDLGTSGAIPQNYDLDHSHAAFVTMYDGGRMDGADRVRCGPPSACTDNAAFRYVVRADVLPYFALAEQYTFADRMFQTNQGPSFPAHQFIIAGTSAPTARSPLFAAENPNSGGPYPTGCLASPLDLVSMINAAGSEAAQPQQRPCFEHPTLTDLLSAAGVSWRYYTPSPGSIWTGPVAIEHICQEQTVGGALGCTGQEWTRNMVISPARVISDAINGDLAQVSWVIPSGLSSDHAAVSDGTGPSWVAAVVNAIGNSSYWSNTAILITWDDWGGWYDHVPPSIVNDGVSWGSGYVYGFRVPLIVVSPYARAAYVSHVTHDFGSILRFIEVTFGIGSLGYADAHADDLSDCFDLTQSPLKFQTIAAPLPAAHFLTDRRPPLDPDDD